MRLFSLKSLVLAYAGLVMVGVAMASPAQAKVNVLVDNSSQTMTVSDDGDYYATWKVSTARNGYYTPRGSFRSRRLAVMHYSSKYDNAPMPHSIFFYGGYAIHATSELRSLGRPASHGCVRLHPSNAATLFNLVRRKGAKIVITN